MCDTGIHNAFRAMQRFACMYVYTSSKVHSRPGINRVWVVLIQSCSWSAEQGKCWVFFLSPSVPEKLISRDGFGRPRPASARLFSTLRLNLVLTHGMTPAFRDGVIVHLFIPSNLHRVSPESIGSRTCLSMAFTPESPPAQGQL